MENTVDTESPITPNISENFLKCNKKTPNLFIHFFLKKLFSMVSSGKKGSLLLVKGRVPFW